MSLCYVCAKTQQFGHNVSHSKRRTNRVFLPNIFGKRMRVISLTDPKHEGEIRRIKICSTCLKRAGKFGKVRGERDAVLRGMVVRLVNWQEFAQKEAVAKVKQLKQIEQPRVEEKEELSIEQIVGKKK